MMMKMIIVIRRRNISLRKSQMPCLVLGIRRVSHLSRSVSWGGPHMMLTSWVRLLKRCKPPTKETLESKVSISSKTNKSVHLCLFIINKSENNQTVKMTTDTPIHPLPPSLSHLVKSLTILKTIKQFKIQRIWFIWYMNSLRVTALWIQVCSQRRR